MPAVARRPTICAAHGLAHRRIIAAEESARSIPRPAAPASSPARPSAGRPSSKRAPARATRSASPVASTNTAQAPRAGRRGLQHQRGDAPILDDHLAHQRVQRQLRPSRSPARRPPAGLGLEGDRPLRSRVEVGRAAQAHHVSRQLAQIHPPPARRSVPSGSPAAGSPSPRSRSRPEAVALDQRRRARRAAPPRRRSPGAARHDHVMLTQDRPVRSGSQITGPALPPRCPRKRGAAPALTPASSISLR